MNPDLILGIIMVVAGGGFAVWAVATKSGGVAIFTALALAFIGVVSLTSGVLPSGPAKTGVLAFLAAVAVVMLVLSIIRNRRPGARTNLH
jgi:hypothetical protein